MAAFCASACSYLPLNWCLFFLSHLQKYNERSEKSVAEVYERR
ncbi:hypothetical protein CHCC20335_1468 [Bacillus paralicheniformis]|nr:hypothetical protein CHCC20335_1468 [Bacillus paralicheniformis]